MSQEKAQLIAPLGNMTVPGVTATGVITATSFEGNIAGSATSIKQGSSVSAGVVTASSFVGNLTGNIQRLADSGPNISVGVVTATSFSGNLTGSVTDLTGTPTITVGIVTATTLQGALTGDVTGDVTGNVTGLAGSIRSGANLNVGVATAVEWYGDGSALTGAGSSASIAQEVTASGDETIIDLSDGNLIYLTQDTDGAQTTVGFASTSPAEQITIIRNPNTASSVAWDISLSTGGVDFDGSDDRLDTTLITAPGTSDFTLEYWVKQDTLTDWQTHFSTSRGSGFNVGTDASGDFVMFASNGGGRVIEVVGAITTGVWYHWAFVRYNGVTTGYINGVAQASFNDSLDYSPTTASIGNLVGEGSEYTNGVISNLRLVVGTAIYTSDFTPPSSALTNVTNTKLLCCQSTTDDTAAAVGNTLTATSSPTAGAQTVAASGATSVGAYTITWPNTVTWKDGTIPTLISSNEYTSAMQIFRFTTGDTGASYQAWEEMKSNLKEVSLWFWGRANYGTSGLNDRTTRSSPTQIPGKWSPNFYGNKSNLVATVPRTDGTLWSWGYANGGNLGLNDNVSYSSPVQVGSDTTWSQSSSGSGKQTLAIKTNGTLWSWGGNDFGSLGQNYAHENGRVSSPTQVGTDSNWDKVSADALSSTAFKTNGTLHVWGGNGDGALGLNDVVNRSSPTQVGTDTTWDSSTVTNAGDTYSRGIIKTDGTLWVWGRNQEGDLGQNQSGTVPQGGVYYSSPTQMGAARDWASVSQSGNSGLATKTDGTLWAWGRNNAGGLGQNNKIQYSSPVQIPGTNWSNDPQDIISEGVGGGNAWAMKTDGTMWGWGANTEGQLGQNNLIQRSSPIQLPGTDWAAIPGVSSGSYAQLAMRYSP